MKLPILAFPVGPRANLSPLFIFRFPDFINLVVSDFEVGSKIRKPFLIRLKVMQRRKKILKSILFLVIIIFIIF